MTGRLIPSKGGRPVLVYYYDGSDWRPARLDTSGHLQIDVLSTVMDAAAATAANQALILAQLQLIEDMRDALQSVAKDRLLVRGMDQLFSFKGVLASTNTRDLGSADGPSWSGVPPAGEYWHVTQALAVDNTSATTSHLYRVSHDTVEHEFWQEVAARGALVPSFIKCDFWLDPLDSLNVYFMGGLQGDEVTIRLLGHIMTLET